jgi:hypothetical protein
VLVKDLYPERRTWAVFENRVLRKTTGPKTDKTIGDWRSLHNEELQKLHSSQIIVRVIQS